MLLLIVGIIIGFTAITSRLVIIFNIKMCMESQMKAVNDIESLVGEVMETGVPVIEFLEVQGACTECIWYNVSFEKVEIKFKTMVTSYSVDVSMPWNKVNKNDNGECENTYMQAGNTYTIEIHPNYITCVNCQ